MNRRTIIKTSALALPAILTSSKTSDPIPEIGHGDFRYRLNKQWSKADHNLVPLNNCHEMVQASDGRLFLLTDQAKNNILIYDKSGQLLDHWTLKLGRAHGLTLSHKDGKDTLWITDNGGRVIETDLEGNILRELPHGKAAAEAGCRSTGPTETAIGTDGCIYVIDGYGTQMVYKFSPKGEFIKKFGGKSTQPVNRGTFMQAHGIALDERGETPALVCTGRIKNEFSWFDPDGKFLSRIYLPGAFMSRPVIHGNELYSGVCFGFKPNDFRMWQGRGFVLILNKDNKVVSCPGASAPTYDGGALKPLLKEGDHFNNVHDVCIDDDGDIYACQWNSGKVPPYKLERI